MEYGSRPSGETQNSHPLPGAARIPEALKRNGPRKMVVENSGPRQEGTWFIFLSRDKGFIDGKPD